MKKNFEEITVIIVTYNSGKVISNCLKSLKKNKIKTIIVDNDSSDNTIKIVNKDYPEAEVINSGGNLGYGRGNNIGLKAVKTKYALILNPDAVIEPDSIIELLKSFKKDKKIILSAPLYIDPLVSKDRYVNLSINKPYAIENDLLYVKWVSGCCLCIDVKKLKEKIGFFDEKFFLFFEEDDLLDRMKEAGFKIVIPTKSIVFHECGTGSVINSNTSYRRLWHFNWSRLYYKEKRKGKFRAKIKAFRIFIALSTKILLKKAFGVSVKNKLKPYCSSSFSYLVGLGAFKADRKTPRV